MAGSTRFVHQHPAMRGPMVMISIGVRNNTVMISIGVGGSTRFVHHHRAMRGPMSIPSGGGGAGGGGGP